MSTAAATAAPAAPDASAPDGPRTTRDHVAWLMRYWRPHWRFGLFLVALTLVSTAVTVAWPLVLQRWLDRLGETLADRQAVLWMLGIMGMIAFGRLVAGVYPSFRAWMNMRVEVAVRERLFGAIVHKSHAFLGRHRTGDLVTRLTDDITDYPRIAWFACSGVFRFLDSASKFVLCIALMLFVDARLAALALLPVPVMLFVFYRARGALGEAYTEQQRAVSQTNDLLESAFTGIRIVKAFNADAGQQSRLSAILRGRIGIQLRLAKLHAMIHQADAFASRLGQVLVLLVGGLAVVDGRISIGTLFAIYLYLEMLVHPMMDLPNLFVTARQAFVSVDRVDEVMRDPDVFRPAESGDDPGPLRTVALEGVSFRHRPDGPWALHGLDVAFRAGERVALVGAVASGKSTLLRLLAGLLPPTEGTVRVNGRPWGDWRWADLRGRIGYVPQESTLFSETIADNVTFGRTAAGDRAWVERCLHVAQMDDDLAQLGLGLETRLGRAGTLVSGGQKQRVAIARALAGRPDLLLFDDCTASLDARNEDRFWAELARAFPEAITVFVSHRLATIRRADRIVVLAEGRLLDQGTHDELADRCDAYRGFLLTEAKREHLRDAEPSADAVPGEE